MAHLHSTTSEHKKGQHLLFEHRVLIQTRLKDGWNPNQIAKEIGCAPNTVRNEIKRGTAALYMGNIPRYKATARQAVYEKNRQACCRYYEFFEKADFISFVEKKFFEDGCRWMLVSAMLWKKACSPESRWSADHRASGASAPTTARHMGTPTTQKRFIFTGNLHIMILRSENMIKTTSMLLDELRIDEDDLQNLDHPLLTDLASKYRATNLKKLPILLRRL